MDNLKIKAKLWSSWTHLESLKFAVCTSHQADQLSGSTVKEWEEHGAWRAGLPGAGCGRRARCVTCNLRPGTPEVGWKPELQRKSLPNAKQTPLASPFTQLPPFRRRMAQWGKRNFAVMAELWPVTSGRTHDHSELPLTQHHHFWPSALLYFCPYLYVYLISCTGEGNGRPLQCFCLENPVNSMLWQT